MIIELSKEEKDDKEFLQDGLFCEYAYIYNQENDTLEIYRGFFNKKQAFDTKHKILNSLEDNGHKEGREPYFCHLIMIIDRKKHTKKQVLQAFKKYDNQSEKSDKEKTYPEHKIIPLEVPENYVPLV